MRALRKYLSYLLVLVLGIGCLGLVACGSSSSSSDSGGASKEEAAEETKEAPAAEPEVVDPSEKFLGDWKLAGLQSQGVTMVGDLSAIAEDATSALSVREDGTGTFVFSDDSTELTWLLEADDKISVTFVEVDEDNGIPPVVDVTYEDDTLSLQIDSDDMSGTLIYSKDGKLTKWAEIKVDDATDITSTDALVGTWNLSGLRMMGLSVYGDAETLEAMAGDSADSTLTFNADGTVTVFGSEVTWTVDENGASIGESGMSISVKALGDSILLDFNSILGMDLMIVYSRA